VKALGAALGRFVLVFNCDETFDFSAMGRLLAGLSQVGAWGCFDEFNRLEERILSAVSQQILTIQRGLLDRRPTIELLGRSISLHDNVGIFITMNPGYAGRRNLPDNLKNLFRSFAMVVPDRMLIAEVMLFRCVRILSLLAFVVPPFALHSIHSTFPLHTAVRAL
jgi:dynein heavy chain 1, cytosolic